MRKTLAIIFIVFLFCMNFATVIFAGASCDLADEKQFNKEYYSYIDPDNKTEEWFKLRVPDNTTGTLDIEIRNQYGTNTTLKIYEHGCNESDLMQSHNLTSQETHYINDIDVTSGYYYLGFLDNGCGAGQNYFYFTVTSSFVAPVRIEGVPDYNQDVGTQEGYVYSLVGPCSPTATACILGYWDRQGYNTILDDGERELITALEMNSNYKWDEIFVNDESQTGTFNNSMEQAIEIVCNLSPNEYGFRTVQLYYPSFSAYKDEIDSGRPVHLTLCNVEPYTGFVDADDDDDECHAVTGIGYDETNNQQKIIFYDNWEPEGEESLEWGDWIAAMIKVIPGPKKDLTISGTVTDGDGNGIPGVQVIFWRWDYCANWKNGLTVSDNPPCVHEDGWKQEGSAYTDANGNYSYTTYYAWMGKATIEYNPGYTVTITPEGHTFPSWWDDNFCNDMGDYDLTNNIEDWDFAVTGESDTRLIRITGDLAFGNVTVEESATRTMTIYNDGNATLTVSSINYPSGFSGNWSGTIAAGGSHAVTVTFSPTAEQSYGGTITVNSDKTSGTNTRSCSGTGVASSVTVLKYDDGIRDQGIVPYSDDEGSEVAVRFTPTTYPAKLQSVQFYVTGYSGEAASTPFAVRIYDDDNGDFPGTQLDAGNITGSATNANEWVTIIVSQQNIIITEGDFFVSMYWLAPSGASGENIEQIQILGLDTTQPDGRSFLKWGGSGAWYAMAVTPAGDRDAMIRAVVGESSGALEIELADAGVIRVDDPVSNNTEYFVKVTDSEGISDDGSFHTVKVKPPSGSELTLEFHQKNNSTSAFYHLWKSDVSPQDGDYVFTVTAADGRTASVTDQFESHPILPVDYQSIQVIEDGTTPVVSWTSVPGAGGYQVNIYDSTGDLYYFTNWTKTTSIKIRPSVLQPNSQYRCRIRAAREEGCAGNPQNTSWSYLDRTKGTSFQTSDETTYPCEGLCYDDGTMSTNNQPWSDEIGSEIAVRFSSDSYPVSLQKVQFFVGAYNEPATQFEVRIYDDDNGDYPGTRLDGGTLLAAALRGNTWVELDVSSENIVLGQGDFFVSMYWKKAPGSQRCFAQALGNDKTPPIHAGTCWKWGASGEWYLVESSHAGYGNSMIRAVVSPATTCPPCSGESPPVHDVTFKAGMDCECVGTVSMTIGPNVTVEKGARVVFRSPKITVASGVHAEPGAVVEMKRE